MNSLHTSNNSTVSSHSNSTTATATDKIEIRGSRPSARDEHAEDITGLVFRRYLNPRVKALQYTTNSGISYGLPGLVPPYWPDAPQLRPVRTRRKSGSTSPLHNLAHSVFPNTAIRTSRRMPHATSMPQSGFQALVLCGPGIGLNTFTSVPSEHPKALVELANRPVVWYVLDWCYRMGVSDITIITPSMSKDAIAAALAQNPYLTSLPSPSPDLLAPTGLEFTTPTADLLRLPEVQNVIKSDFILLPCDLVCSIGGDVFLETYMTRVGSLGGVGPYEDDFLDSRINKYGLGGLKGGRRGGLSIWYNTTNREESVKNEECDFMCTTKLKSEHDLPVAKASMGQIGATMRELVWTMPMSELWDQCEEDKSWKIRQSLLRKHGFIKCMTTYRDSHIYFLPYWVKEFAKINEEFENISEDLIGTWAKTEWRKPEYRERYGVRKLFSRKDDKPFSQPSNDRQIEDEVDLMSLSSTQVSIQPPASQVTTKKQARLASRVQARPGQGLISPDNESDDAETVEPLPAMPPILSCILPSSPDTPLVRRVDTTPLLLSVSLLLAKIPSIEETGIDRSSISPFAHPMKVHPTVVVAPRVTISRSDTLIDANTTIATQCVVKSSVIGSAVSIGTGARITGCLIMDGATIGEKCVLTGTVVGKKAKVCAKSTLQSCEVQDGNIIPEGTEGKGEKYLVGGLEDDMSDEGEYGVNGDDKVEDDGEDLSL